MLLLLYITIALLLIYGVLITCYESWWRDIAPFSTEKFNVADSNLKVTVIIPARNEEKNIINCLRSISSQTYPAQNIQVIVVNDHSTDNTVQAVRSFPANNITLLHLKEHIDNPINSYKKKAIEIAIAHSTGELIITTDADCTATPGWIETIVAFYQHHKAAFIAAPVKIESNRSLLSIFQSLDFLTLQGVTGASVHKRIHSMCNGANLAYEKKAFYEVNGFKGIDSIASGDDMLLMHKIFQKYPDRVFYLKSPDAIITTNPAYTWRELLNQRIRWASKADKYDDKRIFFVLLLVYLLNLLLLIILLGSVVNRIWLFLGLAMILCKFLLEISFVKTVARFFRMTRSLIYFPFIQPLHIIYTVAAGFLGKFSFYKWKGRRVK